MDDRERYRQGLELRRKVLGNQHVDRTLEQRNSFNEDFQDFITRYAWGEVWPRPGLPLETRSLITLGLMLALNRNEEFRMHVRSALGLGISRDQIREVLMQVAIYCGLPAANVGFHIAEEVFAENFADAPPQTSE
jgi:4-carboxymuconolactone decarboxylase